MSNESDPGLTPSKWLDFFRQANVRTAEIEAAKSSRAKGKIISQFLGNYVGRAVPIEVDGRRGTAILRCREGRSRQKYYWFTVAWADDDVGDENDSESQLEELLERAEPRPAEQQEMRRPEQTSDSGGNDEEW